MTKHYLTKEDLKRYLIEAQAGRMPAELIDAVRLMVAKLHGSEDDEQDCLLSLLKTLPILDPHDEGMFSYLTCMAMSAILQGRRKAATYEHLKAEYGWKMGGYVSSAGRPAPLRFWQKKPKR